MLSVQFSVLSEKGKIVDWQKEKKLEFDPDEEGDSTLRPRISPGASSSSSSSSSSATPPLAASKIYYFVESSGPTQISQRLGARSDHQANSSCENELAACQQT